MIAPKTHLCAILELVGLSPSRRHGSGRTRRRPLPLNLERFEDRVVPAVVSLINAAAPIPVDAAFKVQDATYVSRNTGSVSSFYGDNELKFSQQHDHESEICVTFQLNLTATEIANTQLPVSKTVTLASYTITNAGNATQQTLFHTETFTLTRENPTATLCVDVDDDRCDQVDAYYNYTSLDLAHFQTNGDVTGAIFHPTFSTGPLTFTDELTNLGGTLAPQHILQDCDPGRIGNFGLTIGFWKNHSANWQGYAQDTTLGSVFDLSSYRSLQNMTFAQALEFGGGPSLSDKAGLLVKQAVGALLNAANDQVGYPITTHAITVEVNDALNSMNAATIGALQSQLDAWNSVDISLIPNPVNNHQR